MTKLNTVLAISNNLSNRFAVDTDALPTGFTGNFELSADTVRPVAGTITAKIVREELATPKQALITGIVFGELLDVLLVDREDWATRMVCYMDEAAVNGKVVEPFDVMSVLCELDFIVSILGTTGLYIAGDATFKAIELDAKAYAPIPLDQPIVRRRNYGSTEMSKLVKDTIHVLENVPVCKSDVMTDIASEVFEIDSRKGEGQQLTALLAEQHVLRGTVALESGVAHHTEFHADNRGRLYQTACYGFNGQSSDLARSLQDLHGVSMDYDANEAKQLLIDEMLDMGSFKADVDADGNMMAVEKSAEFIRAYQYASNKPVEFITANLKANKPKNADAKAAADLQTASHIANPSHPKCNVKKPWNFAKFSLIMKQLGKFLKGEAPKPYIGIAVGLDAKCSGAQIAALMTGDDRMLTACGFSDVEVADAYHYSAEAVKAALDIDMPRGDIKKPFMAIFYGAGVDAMKDQVTIEKGAFDLLYNDSMDEDEMTEIAKKFHKAVQGSFGTRICNLRKRIKSMGFDREAGTSRLAEAVKYTMPDGLVVAMDYKQAVNLDGDVIDLETKAHHNTVVTTNDSSMQFKKLAFRTKTTDVDAYARTGFVNLIQATDALIARLIVTHCHELGAKHIISIHDCFRVSITDMAILNQAIINAYKELFTTATDTATDHLPLGTDITKMYFEGSFNATKELYKPVAPAASQFIKGKGIRRTSYVGKSKLVDLIDNLGTSYYFAK